MTNLSAECFRAACSTIVEEERSLEISLFEKILAHSLSILPMLGHNTQVRTKAVW